MDDDREFRRAVRRVLFDDKTISKSVPGGGRDAAEIPERHTRAKVTMNLDGDVLAYFRAQAKKEGRAYQSLINQVLREYIEGSRPQQLAAQVRALLLDDAGLIEGLADKVQRALLIKGRDND
ncbi:MAG TPA: BrnA antitoxin family protein [Oligoflexia bacterium]|nr:BrnA antitoxin family protein [Oligoflexia bacterium]